tara:strand:- start:187 stop:402 length:216 start_codon:yes stop_codon:yes gene_type:complete
MVRITKEFLIGELLEIIASRQLAGEVFPEMPSERIEHIADLILFEWNEYGDEEADIYEVINVNLNDNIKFG